jgi:uncharacterized protein (DUF1501 family)
MKRRNFLQKAAATLLGPVLIDGFGARAMAAPSSLIQRLLAAAGQSERVLVIIQLQGGNDGLNMVLPLDQMGVYTSAAFRGSIAIPEAKALKLTGYPGTGLHPAMTGMQQMFTDGQLSIVQGAGYPSFNFSHFRASDIWMTAVDASQTTTSGWTGRYLNERFPGYPTAYPTSAMPDPPAIQIGYVSATTLLGPTNNMSVVLQDPDTFARLVGDKPNSPDTSLTGYAGKQIEFLRQQQFSSVSYAGQIKAAATKGQNISTYPTTSLAAQLKIIARLIHGGLQTKVYYLTLGGFDTHALQTTTTDTTTGTHATLLKTLSDAIAAFQTDLVKLKVDDKVIGMTFSEFGRRAIANGSFGTDHGTSAPMFVFGSGVKTRMIGKNPDLSNLDNNNLRMQTDFRQVYAAIMTDWFGGGAATETTALFRDFTEVPIFRQTVTAIEPLPVASGRLYPNPATGEVVLEADFLNGSPQQVRLVDMQGRTTPINAGRPEMGVVRFSVANLPTGTYVLQVENERGRVSQRLLVNH